MVGLVEGEENNYFGCTLLEASVKNLYCDSFLSKKTIIKKVFYIIYSQILHYK